MSGQHGARKRISLEHLERLEKLVEEFMGYAQSLSDAALAYLILGFNEMICDERPGYFLWQQLALTELHLRRTAQGKR